MGFERYWKVCLVSHGRPLSQKRFNLVTTEKADFASSRPTESAFLFLLEYFFQKHLACGRTIRRERVDEPRDCFSLLSRSRTKARTVARGGGKYAGYLTHWLISVTKGRELENLGEDNRWDGATKKKKPNDSTLSSWHASLNTLMRWR